jgi:glucose/arabinose dehydrogenase
MGLAPAGGQEMPPVLENPAPGQVFLTPPIDLELGEVPLLVPEKFKGTVPEDRVLRLPAGFAARVFAAGPPLEGPRFMDWSPEGVLHVANMKAGGGGQFTPRVDTSAPPGEERMFAQVLALPDRDRDGVADTMIVAADRLWFPNSIQFYQGDLYVADMHQVLRLRDQDGDGYFEQRQVVIPDLPVGHHRTRTILFDQSSNRLYLSIGSSCDLCRETDPRRATIMVFDPDGSNGRVFATGLRNAVGMALHPFTGELWATVNGHDREGRVLPPERIDIVRQGQFYGWPLAYGYRTWVDFTIGEYQSAVLPLTEQDSLDVEKVSRPVGQVPAHLAPMGIHFYQGQRFPAQYRNAAFVALRGGGNAAVEGHKVMALFSEPDGNGARLADFLTGFQPDPRNGNSAWGKPVGIEEDSAGNLYVSSDWVTHLILQVVPDVLRGAWEGELPERAFSGARLVLRATIRVSGLDAAGEEPEVFADLSQLGGPAMLALTAAGDSTFFLEAELDLDVPTGPRTIEVHIAQVQGEERLATRLRRSLLLLPGADLMILGEPLAAAWQVEGDEFVQAQPGSAADPAHQGAVLPLLAQNVSFRGWNVRLVPGEVVDPLGYRALSFAFHPGNTSDTERPRFTVTVKPGGTVDLLKEGLVDLGVQVWQEVEIPLASLALEGPIENIRFAGNLEGKFYLAGLRLVTATPRPQDTAVAQVQLAGKPQAFSLEQNYPNPFNSTTVIRFALPQDGRAELVVYNLAGQRVAALAQGWRAAGIYQLEWDGRDDRGRPLASGVYIYRLRLEDRVEARKLLLLR